MNDKIKAELGKLIPLMKDNIARYKAFAVDGWTYKEIIKFIWEVLSDTVEKIQAVSKDLSGDEKKELAIEFIKFVFYDKAGLNNPTIPGVPGFVGSIIKKYVFKNVVPSVIDQIVALFKKYKVGEFLKYEGDRDIRRLIPNE